MSVAMAVSPSSSSLNTEAPRQQDDSQVPLSSGLEPGTLQPSQLVSTSNPLPATLQTPTPPPPHFSSSQQQQMQTATTTTTLPPPPGLQAYGSQIPAQFFRPGVVQPPTLQPPGVMPGTMMPSSLQPLEQQGASNPPNGVLGFGQLGVQVMPPGAPAVVPAAPPTVRPSGLFPISAQQYPTAPPPRPFGQPPNGSMVTGPPGAAAPQVQQQQQPSHQMMNQSVIGSAHAGMPRYSAPYPPMVRPTYPTRPPGNMGMMPLPRPPIQGVRPMPQVLKFPTMVTTTDPASKGPLPILALAEKPQTTVYVGKIALTVENDFLQSLLKLCGTIKSWKRAQDPTNGTPKGFGFCEFETAEGVLRALRLLNKFCLEGQELVLNVNQATREYLERYVQKKIEREKQIKEAEVQDADKEEETAPGVEKEKPPKPPVEAQKKDNGDSANQDQDSGKKFGIVNDADREADEDMLMKLKNMLEERSKLKPLPPPPPLPPTSEATGKSISTSEAPARSKDADSDVEILKSDVADDKNEDDTTSENKPTSEHERPETSSTDRGRRYDRVRDRERDRDRDKERDKDRDKREKEQELERYERERERERLRRERDREMRLRDAERIYEEREREWEAREKDKERQRQYEREREKDRERERRREIKDQEEESDDEDWRKRRHRSSMHDEKRKRRQWEKEEDIADRLREEQEIAEAKKRKYEEKRQDKESKVLLQEHSQHSDVHESEDMCVDEVNIEHNVSPVEQGYECESGEGTNQVEAISRNGNAIISGEDDISAEQLPGTDSKQNSNAPTRKLGFGLIGSGKRTAVPSFFHQEDDEDMPKEKRLRPLVPIDYSAEEMQAVSTTSSGTALNLAAAADFAKRISTFGPKEERADSERERNRKQSDRSSRNDDDILRSREEGNDRSRERDRGRDKYERDHAAEKSKALENKKLLDAKQLIDTIPKTKEELFSYNIDWAIYDKHNLHERMRPWISKKITEFLGEEEPTLVDFVVSNMKKHETATHMLEVLESILDDEAEMFVLKMWRMLIFEIKKVETGLTSKSKS